MNDYLLPAIISEFVTCYPNIKLTIQELSTDEIELELERGQLQVALGFVPPTRPCLDTFLLGEERLALIVRKDHPFAHHDEVQVNVLDAISLVMLTNSFCTRRLWEENARLASATPRIMMEINTLSGLLSTVQNTGIPTILPYQIVTSQRATDLVSIPLVEPIPSRQVGLLWNKDHYLCSASRAFIAIAKEVSQTVGFSLL